MRPVRFHHIPRDFDHGEEFPIVHFFRGLILACRPHGLKLSAFTARAFLMELRQCAMGIPPIPIGSLKKDGSLFNFDGAAIFDDREDDEVLSPFVVIELERD